VNALETIAARAAENGLTFLLAGGHAVIAHGHSRNTFDLDLIICRDARESWVRVVQEMGYALYHEGPTFLQFNSPKKEDLPLDLMLVNGETFGKLMAEAKPASPSAPQAKVVSLRHLLSLKCHAIKFGHPGRIVKDADDVLQLVLVNGIDMNAPEMRGLFLKHGNAELYEKVRRISTQK
jgi:hypothetical protein